MRVSRGRLTEEREETKILCKPELSPRPRSAAFVSRVVRALPFDRLDTRRLAALSVCPLHLRSCVYGVKKSARET